MSHTAHIPSHRKPRRSASRVVLRAGVASGVLGTLAVAGSSGPASATEPVTDTIEMPTLTTDLGTQTEVSADATQQAASDYALRAEQQTAAAKAAKTATEAQATAEKKAEEAKKKAAAEAAARKAAEAARTSRSQERTTLSASSGTSSNSGSSDLSVPASGSVATVVSFLKAQLGDAYIMGGTGPNSWDCSGLVQAAFRQAGVSLPRTSQAQSTAGTQVPLSSVQVGDILYWGGAGSAYHVGVYVGDGQYLDAANPSKGVVTQDLSGYPASGAIRVL
ncbi:C40 family peptidase [Streptomyces sp. NPDC050560]|uniref:C40 family peptidase n=1 Tax=Streptomyces sp. NPDC050560 TaxID=3365630 RepID=UPI0037A32352